MELGLSLGGINRDSSSSKPPKKSSAASKHLSFKDTRLSLNTKSTTQDDDTDIDIDIDIDIDVHSSQKIINDKRIVPIHNILTLAPLLHPFPHHSSDDGSLEGDSPVNIPAASGLDMNKVGAAAAVEVSSGKRRSDQMIYRSGDVIDKRSLASDDDYENGLITRKKLRLSKQQSDFLEQSFKQHNSLKTIQKHALAKQLNLSPRQVEVWFQNRRARTKLKQTEVDCEYLKKCSEALTEENKKLKKELQELRALKTSTMPHYYNYKMQSPTLTMCSSCEATTSSFPLSRSKFSQAYTNAS